MADKTGIEWTDATWNPVTGCTKVSDGCDHCYAETLFNRFNGPGAFDTVRLRPERLDVPLKWRKPKRVFVNSMSDLFHDDVPDAYIGTVFEIMAGAGRHTFQVLTKRHGRMRSLLKRWAAEGIETDSGYRLPPHLPRGSVRHTSPLWSPPPNVWLGVSVEDQRTAGIRIPALLDTPAAVRFLSCEPLLGPVNLSAWFDPPQLCECGPYEPVSPTCTVACRQTVGDAWLDWVIVGGESGHGARPMNPEWARSLRDQCANAEVSFLFKQWGEWAPCEGRRGPAFSWVTYDGKPEGIRIVPEQLAMRRVGKKAAGRELDGRTWDEYPRAGER